MKKHRQFSEQMEKDIQEIVDFYMQYVTGEHRSIREGLEYYWKCMSDYTIEDYLEVAREGKANMNNEPVAWIDPKELDMAVSTSVTKHKQFDTDIPLYTHPVKELTDEEIMECFKEVNLFTANMVDVARAILKKAQGK
jgi:hypothetical protein